MADVSDVEKLIVQTIAKALFPSINYLPGDSQISSAGCSVRLYRGWPVPGELDKDLAQGICNVSVFPAPNVARNTTRFAPDPYTVGHGAPTLTATISGRLITFGGTGGAGQVVGIATGKPWSATYAYRLTAQDTPSSVAAAFAATIPGASASGSVLTLQINGSIYANVVADAISATDIRRQEQWLKITVWAPNPTIRDAVAPIVDVAIQNTRRFTFPDGSISGYPKYHGSFVTDGMQEKRIFRRDITFSVDYATSVVQTLTPMLFLDIDVMSIVNQISVTNIVV